MKTSLFALVFAFGVVGCGGDSTGAGGGGGDAPSGGSPSGGDPSGGPDVKFGDVFEGGEFNLGPVDYEESAFHNACAPGTKYRSDVASAEGDMLAGLWGGLPNVAGLCDACIQVDTAKGKTAVLRVVTYGDTTTNSIDVSANAYAQLDSGEYPRSMTWQLVECPGSGPMFYEFQTCSSQWWTSLWVRDARVPLAKVEVKSANHPSFVELDRGGDGTLTDGGGFGEGAFTLRSTGVDGAVVEQEFEWPSAGLGGAFLTGSKNFD